MAHAIIDRENRTITITKAFNAKASIYNSKEYDDLAEIQNAHPSFRLIIKAAKRKSIPLGRITYEQMEKYIKAHDDSNETHWNEYQKLRGVSDDAGENEDEINVNVSVSFFQIKKWFVKTFPEITKEIDARKKEINEIMNKEVK
jgi:hypothetical protein